MNFLKQINNLKQKIEALDNIHHKKILKILIENKIKYSENRNGVFVNMNLFNLQIIKIINEELIYISKQEKHLNDVELIKHELNTTFFDKDSENKI
tara:strand:- start:136 stop:423 length:288 start_codon:yes stop_codon:yes gene_type:complete